MVRLEGRVLFLEGSLDVHQAESLRDLLQSLVQEQGASGVEVEARQVESADMAILQVLVSAQLTCQAMGGRLNWRGISPALKDMMEETGLHF